MKTIIPLAQGFEEIETITIIDVLRRAELNVVVAGVGGLEITGARGVKVIADTLIEDVTEAENIILPGGMPGSVNLGESEMVKQLVCAVNEKSGVVGAICAAPAVALNKFGILEGKTATCYPGFEEKFSAGVTFSEDSVVIDGNIITSRGVGTAMEFALMIVARLVSKEVSDKLRGAMLVS